MVARVTLDHLVKVRILSGQSQPTFKKVGFFYVVVWQWLMMTFFGRLLPLAELNSADPQRILVGSVMVFLCVALFLKERWFLENTKKGKRLTAWFGQKAAPVVLRGLILLGILFGSLLAMGIIRPIRWD